MNKRLLTQEEREECVPTDDELKVYLATPDDGVARKLREKLTPELFGKFALVILYSENAEKAQDAKTLEGVGEHLSKRHPYQEDIFPTSVKQAGQLLRDKGLTEREITAISGCICRVGYNTAISNIKDLLD